MDRQHVSLLAVGAGPANLALAVALEELAPAELASNTLIIEQHDSIIWQRGMLLPWTQTQVSFLKDLVTLRNPRSRFSFLSYLHSVGRLDEFINLGTFNPYRIEISSYLQWVATSLRHVQISYGCRCVSVEPLSASGEADQWLVRLADGREITCENLVIGVGRDPHIPAELAGLPADRIIHSTEFRPRVAELDPGAPLRAVVVGGAQSAAEMLVATHESLPLSECTMVMRSIGLNTYESSKFTNELFYPSFVSDFHAAAPQAREQLLREMHRTNYSGLAPWMLDNLYRTMYLERLTGHQRIRMVTMAEITSAEMADGEVVLVLTDRRTRAQTSIRCDVIMLGTGFDKKMPRLVRDLAKTIGAGEIAVNRNYRMKLEPAVTAGCYLQGVNEATHGIADSLLSVLAIRAQEIVTDLLTESDSKEERWNYAVLTELA